MLIDILYTYRYITLQHNKDEPQSSYSEWRTPETGMCISLSISYHDLIPVTTHLFQPICSLEADEQSGLHHSSEKPYEQAQRQELSHH